MQPHLLPKFCHCLVMVPHRNHVFLFSPVLHSTFPRASCPLHQEDLPLLVPVAPGENMLPMVKWAGGS